jgi:hypothetical protein
MADLTPLVRLVTRERYCTDEEYRVRRCMYSARYYVQKRMMAGKTVKSKYEPPTLPEDNILTINSTPTCPESAST